MEKSVHREICAILDAPRPFFYFRDRYALALLGWAAGGGRRKRELAKGPFARLLTKPAVVARLKAAGDGIVDEARLTVWPARYRAFRVTLGAWGRELGAWRPSHDQTARPGTNLVVQLNFAAEHDRHYAAIVRPYRGRSIFNYHKHPVSKIHHTLAWARVDLDLDTREALIEEVQSDWVRLAQRMSPHHRGAARYVERILWPYRRIWAEATLTATLELLYRELGIRRVFFHTAEGGARLKELPPKRCPPRAIYEKLPRQFCFRRTDEAPRFLRDAPEAFVRERVRRAAQFSVLDLPR